MKKFAGNNTEVELGYITGEDPTFWVMCECGNKIDSIVSDWKLIRCPNCGKGYIGEFVVWQYDVNEDIDPMK